jgi:hypothetical protein
MERRGRKGSSCARSEEMERAGDRLKKMAGYCSTGQSPQRAAVLMEEEEEELQWRNGLGSDHLVDTDEMGMGCG